MLILHRMAAVTLACLTLCPTHARAQVAAPHVLPAPREMRPAGPQPIPQGIHINCGSCSSDQEDEFTMRDLNQALAARAVPTTGPFSIVLSHTSALTPGLPAEAQSEGYIITPSANSLTLAASSTAGLFYAAQTLKQLIEGDGPTAVLHLATIRDWPAMKYRGLQDDLSRGPVPTLAFQKHMIQVLAAYKGNLYSPYFEHTQQYASNPLPAPPGGSISAADARELVAFAAHYHVTIIPEQEAFGHLHHNLTWELYQPLAETAHGAVLAPAQPGSLTYIQQMFTELAQLYPGPFLHIGADETADLGIGQTKSEVDARGLGPVYLDFLQKIVTALAPLHRKILFWGDIAQEVTLTSPNLLRDLPASFKQSTIAIPWWYAPNPKGGFAHFLTPFTNAGFETWVAPGISDWNVVYPDNNDALVNIQQFVAEGQRQHSTGALNTIWDDDGESLVNNDWYGILFGAAASWQPGESSIPAFQQTFAQAFHGDATGNLNQAQLALMQAHAILRNQAHVGDASNGLFWIDPWSKDGQNTAAKIRPYLHDVRAAAERALTLIAQARAAYPAAAIDTPASGGSTSAANFNAANAFPSNPTALRNTDAIDALELGARRIDLIGLKFELTDEIMAGFNRAQIAQSSSDKKLHATVTRELGDIRSVNGRIEDLRDTYALLRDLYEQAWLRSNRTYALRPVLEHYDATIQLWQARSDRFRTAQRQYGESKTLPSATELGLPSAH